MYVKLVLYFGYVYVEVLKKMDREYERMKDLLGRYDLFKYVICVYFRLVG